MQMTVKERSTPKDPNYQRFYEFDPGNSEHCSRCPAKCGTGEWNTVLARVRGVPVHTNWPAAGEQPISRVYICESPSDREFSHGLPTVGMTGQGIYKGLKTQGNLEIGWLDWLDDNVYRTNLVRCQADSGLQKRVGGKKNARVKEAANHCFNHLQLKIERIVASQTKPPQFTVAIGSGFPEWKTKVEELIKDTCKQRGWECDPEVVHHPSAKAQGD
jgi:hypothetical protein